MQPIISKHLDLWLYQASNHTLKNPMMNKMKKMRVQGRWTQVQMILMTYVTYQLEATNLCVSHALFTLYSLWYLIVSKKIIPSRRLWQRSRVLRNSGEMYLLFYNSDLEPLPVPYGEKSCPSNIQKSHPSDLSNLIGLSPRKAPIENSGKVEKRIGSLKVPKSNHFHHQCLSFCF